jgi:hypothetical protein
LFSLDKLAKYPIVNTFTSAIHCSSGYGPIFGHNPGSGHNIVIYNDSNVNTNSYVRHGNAYNIPPGANGNHSILTDGNSTFQTIEIEVYSVQ